MVALRSINLKQVLVNLLIFLVISTSVVLFIQNQDLKSLLEKNRKLELKEKETLKLISSAKKIAQSNSLKSASTLTSLASNQKEQPIEEPIQTTTPNINIFDLSKSLEPPLVYSHVKCRKSAKIHDAQTTLCVHNLINDIHVSGSIWSSGVWESQIITPFLGYISQNPSWLVLDFGAQIGQYSLFAASMGRQVLTVEPFYDNIVRLHKAATEEKIQNKIKLVKNALSNKRNEIKRLQPNSDNIGGQSLLQSKNKNYKKSDMANDKYLVETILLDDLVEQLPLNSDGKKYKQAILKIDIEGFEPMAFQHASKFFDAIDIKIIFMEWGNLPSQNDEAGKIVDMIDFLMKRNFVPWGDGIELMQSNWKKWPWDIIWKKKSI